jgi:hypothetical protein
MRGPAFAISALGCFFVVEPAPAGSFCDDLKSIISRSANIEGLAGAAITEDKWQATFLLTGYKSCEIDKLDDGSLIYFCSGDKVPSQGVAVKQYTQAKAMLTSCLPEPAWTHNEMSGPFGNSFFFRDQQGHGGVVNTMKLQDLVSNTNGKTTFVYIPELTVYPQKGHEQSGRDAQEPKVVLEAPVDFCPDFKRLLLAAKDNFVNGMVKKGDRLIPKIQLKGWDGCHIHDLDSEGGKVLYQTCGLPDTSDKKELEDVAAKVHSALKDCLGSDWAEQDSSRRNGCPRFTYELGDNEPEVELRTSSCGKGTEWSLHLDVQSPVKSKSQ